MENSGLKEFLHNIKTLPGQIRDSIFRHGPPNSDRARSQTVFNNFFLHIHSTRVHPHTLRMKTTWGLGIVLISLFAILSVTGILLMVYYNPDVEHAYHSIKDIHFVVPTGRFIRNIHRWSAHLMVLAVILHMARVFYTAAYKGPRQFNWVLGMVLFCLTLGMSFTGYLLPWDQLAYWAITIGANIAASPNELVDSLGLPASMRVGDVQKELLLGSSSVGQDSLTRFYLLHVMVLPLLMITFMAIHMWRIRKDGGIARPEGTPTTAGKGVGTAKPEPQTPANQPKRTYGLMCVVKGTSPHTGKDMNETLPAWPYLLRSELFLFMATMLVCLILGYFFDAPLKEAANPDIPENPAKAPWYFLGLQEMVSYSAFVGGIVIPAVVVIGLTLIPFLDREKEPSGVWFSGARGKLIASYSCLYGAIMAIMSVAIPVKFGWLRNWFPDISQLFIIIFNP
ncbi:MAG: cytochrome b N-terminal domain-containing protein, partial [Planctomycetota bacterium]|nr:cytochrome b N-terminal domain-containing protein [Planctomycetota bacterium]